MIPISDAQSLLGRARTTRRDGALNPAGPPQEEPVSNDEFKDLQDPGIWEDDGGVREPVKSPRAVVSVAFARDDFDRVVEHAQRAGMKTSEFIRSTVLSSIDRHRFGVRILSVAGLAYNDFPTNRTQTSRERGMTMTGDSLNPKSFVTA